MHGAAYGLPGSSPYELHISPIVEDRPTVGGPWRTLEIRMDGDAFAAFWDGNLEYPRTRFPANGVRATQDFLKAPPDPPITFSARGGLGLYVQAGSAAFRNVKLAPGTPP
jgi:hypothetical protein